MLTKSQVRAILDKMESLPEGHFALHDGRHTAQAALPMRVLQQPEYATSLAATLGGAYRTQRPQAVLAGPGPSTILGLELARALRTRLVLAERVDGHWQLAAGQVLQPDERVVICEAFVTDESDVAERAKLVLESGAQVTGVSTLIDRTSAWPHPWALESLVRVEAPMLPAAQCPLCQSGVPLSALDAHETVKPVAFRGV
jgi:orotate phosphoribosyltransferase